jgi:hypothetical protein
MSDTITITLSPEEYRQLLVLTFLGEWMVNGVRKEPDPICEDTASKVYAFAKGTALEELTRFDRNQGDWVASDKLGAEAHALIDEYDDTTFWEELTARLVERDLMAQRGERAVRSMRPEQRIRASKPIAQAYTREFENQGLDRLFVTEGNAGWKS